MILIHGWADIRPAEHARVAAAAEALQAESRTEEGCVFYGLSWAADAAQRLCLLEIWQDSEAYQRHTTMTHVNAFRELANETAAATPTFIRYEATPEP